MLENYAYLLYKLDKNICENNRVFEIEIEVVEIVFEAEHPACLSYFALYFVFVHKPKEFISGKGFRLNGESYRFL